MKLGAVALLFGQLLIALVYASRRDGSNPVRRVVDLLQGLSQKLEQELKEETKLFQRYECWYKSVVAAKAASNSKANSRIDTLDSYIADIEAGRITFTTEQADLEKQIRGLRNDLEEAQTLRTQQNGDFEAAKQEMEQAIAALGDAIQVMKDGTASGASMIDTQERLHRAVLIGRQALNSADAKLLASILSKQVPTPNWKKLNRKADFKMKYKARSGSIIETLEGLEATFTKKLEEATQKEQAAVDAYGKLKDGKEAMLGTAEQSLVDLVEENGARGLSKSEAQAEVEDLKAQVVADTKFSEDVEAAYNAKVQEWEARKELRNNEILSCSKAIAILHSDDARDQFKESFKSQGYSFLQESSPSRCEEHRQRRSVVLSQLSKALKGRQAAEVVALAGQGSIAAVIVKVDELIAMLETEEENDLNTKEKCEADIVTNAQEARMASLNIDDYTEGITRAKTKAAEIQTQIEEEEKTKTTSADELKTITQQRQDETKRYAADKLEDEKAVELLESALTVMKNFKQGGSASFLQLQKTAVSPHGTDLVAVKRHVAANTQKQPIDVVAGQAPPPPPATWENPTYAGAEGESAGIVSILELIKTDVEKDISMADTAETNAQTAFEKQETTLNAAIKAAEDAITQYELDKAAQEQEAIQKDGERRSKKTELDGSLKLLSGLRPGCDYFTVNYEVRRKKRQVEIDGLKGAKAILQGADIPGLLQANQSSDC